MQKVLVLGANGYLGSNICKALKTKGYFVIGASRAPQSCADVDFYLQQDFSDPKSIELLDKQNYEIIIDLISYIAPNDHSIKMEHVRQILNPYAELVKYAFKDKRYIYISSGGTIYGNAHLPCTEEQPLNPLTSYALQKVYQEEIIQKYIKDHIILRVSNPYGGRQKVKNGVGFIASVIESLKSDLPINLTVPGSTIRDYLYINDLEKTIIFCLGSNLKNIVLNVSSGQGISLNEVAAFYAEKLKKELRIHNIYDGKTPTGFISYNVLNNEKLISLTSIKPRHLVDITDEYSPIKGF